MIAYFDTSAFVPLLVDEPGSAFAIVMWDTADRVVSARILYAEARAALALAVRTGRLTQAQGRKAVTSLDRCYEQMDLVEIDDEVVRLAGQLAELHGLRGYGAVHLAAAHQIGGDEVVVVAGDRALLTAAQDAGLSTAAV